MKNHLSSEICINYVEGMLLEYGKKKKTEIKRVWAEPVRKHSEALNSGTNPLDQWMGEKKNLVFLEEVLYSMNAVCAMK